VIENGKKGCRRAGHEGDGIFGRCGRGDVRLECLFVCTFKDEQNIEPIFKVLERLVQFLVDGFEVNGLRGRRGIPGNICGGWVDEWGLAKRD